MPASTMSATPSKKRKHADTASSSTSNPAQNTKQRIAVAVQKTVKSDPASPFRLINATLYLPLSPISISDKHAKASLITEHFSPLLLTYFPPFKGIVLAHSDESISSLPPSTAGQANAENALTPALSANEYGVLYLYISATFLVFSPQKGQILEGWVNVQSEGFLGAIAYNLFSVGIERKRVHRSWKWIPPGADDEKTGVSGKNLKKTPAGEDESNKSNFDSEKEHFTPLPKVVVHKLIPTNDTPEDEQDVEMAEADAGEEEEEDPTVTGYFQSVSGHCVNGTIRFRVRDIDVIPGADPDRGFLSIEGSMLTPEEEAQLEEEERSGPLPSNRQRNPTAMTGGVSRPPAVQNGVTGEQRQQTPVTTEKKEEKKEKKHKKENKSKDKQKSKA